jgi:hypothetical protein
MADWLTIVLLERKCQANARLCGDVTRRSDSPLPAALV